MNLIAHIEIPVTNLERAMNFYSKVFNISFDEVISLHGSEMAYFPFDEAKNGASGALAKGEAYVPTKDGAIIYFSVSDIDETLVKATQLGSEILFPKTRVFENIFVAEISDSEGNRIAIQST